MLIKTAACSLGFWKSRRRHRPAESCKPHAGSYRCHYCKFPQKAEYSETRTDQVSLPDVQFFLPFLLASALFSTQGVLPFTPNIGKFIVSLIILAVLVIVTFVVLLNWESWFRPFLERYLGRIGWIDPPQQWDLEKGPEQKKAT